MKNLIRCALTVWMIAVCGLGCDDGTPDPTPDAGNPDVESPDAGTPDAGTPDSGTPDSGTPDSGIPDSGTPDAGYEWDGTYVPLEERGDNIDTGPLASCTRILMDDAGVAVPCGSPQSFDLSPCNRGTLSQISPDGIYSVRERPNGATLVSGFLSSGFQISTSGGVETAHGYPLVQKQVDSQTLYLTSLRTLTDGGTQLYAFAGCEAQSAEHLTGCYQTCTNGGQRRSFGSFDAVRTQRLSEPEMSGIQFVSEQKVALGTPMDIYVTKGHAYVVSSDHGPATEGGLTVIDVSDKAHPVVKKVVTLSGDNYWNSVWAKGDALYVGSAKHGVLVYDISNPADPQLVRGVPGDAFDVHTIYVDGNRMYAQASGANQVLIFDVSNPLDPVLLTRYTVPADGNGFGYPHDAFAYQNRLYINQMGQGYYVVDVTDGFNPLPLGSYTYDVQPFNPTHANAVGTFAGRTIAFEGGENTNAHLRVLDVTDPAHIVKIGEFAMRPQTSIHNMVLVGKRLYVAWYAEGLRVLDVSNPTQPRQIAYANTFRDSDPGRGEGLFVGAIGIRVPGDGYVYVVDMTRGLLIYREP
ncbi:LVIVD repeat-containing protein [Hyalangium gracile]|uniref:LVIVD repeat-containing protein n=1 Tax=Hyalangium gracile TaxID=394092 RepID=UPI0021E14690|nr:hypothetical protein [Hyalangium gracile]